MTQRSRVHGRRCTTLLLGSALVAVLTGSGCWGYPGPCHGLEMGDEVVLQVTEPRPHPAEGHPDCNPTDLGFTAGMTVRMNVQYIETQLNRSCLRVSADFSADPDTGWSYLHRPKIPYSFGAVVTASRGECEGSLTGALSPPGNSSTLILDDFSSEPREAELYYYYSTTDPPPAGCPASCGGGLLGVMHLERARE
jgi:hypothetical protein